MACHARNQGFKSRRLTHWIHSFSGSQVSAFIEASRHIIYKVTMMSRNVDLKVSSPGFFCL